MNKLPILEIVSIAKLVLHETTEKRRVEKVKSLIKNAKLFTNPPVVTKVANDNYMVLDGANRTTALQELSFTTALVQVVDYFDEDIILKTWNHFISGLTVDKVKNDFSSYLVSENLDDNICLGINGSESIMVKKVESLAENISLLNNIIDLYKGKLNFYRTTEEHFAEAKREYPDGDLLLVFSKFSKQELVEIANQRLFIPSGISRHIINGRAINVDIPIELLKDNDSMESKNNKLQEIIERRIHNQKIRFYKESTYIYND